MDLPGSQQASADVLRDLQEGLWLDRGTRVVFIDFSVYNANINLFCVLRWPLSLLHLSMHGSWFFSPMPFPKLVLYGGRGRRGIQGTLYQLRLP